MARTWFRRALVGVVLLALVANGFAYMHARAMTRFVGPGERTLPPNEITLAGKIRALFFGVRIPHPLNTRTPAAVGLDFETRRFAGEAGELEAWEDCPNHEQPAVPPRQGSGREKQGARGYQEEHDEAEDLSDIHEGYPFTQASGKSLATLRARRAAWAASTTALMSL